MRRILLSLVLAAATVAAAPAYAHAHLKKAYPAVGAAVSPGPAQLRLSFSEGVELTFSKVEIDMADGTAVTPSAVALAVDDPATIVVTLKRPLAPGHYNVSWHVVSVDTHRTQGHYAFTVTP